MILCRSWPKQYFLTSPYRMLQLTSYFKIKMHSAIYVLEQTYFIVYKKTYGINPYPANVENMVSS